MPSRIRGRGRAEAPAVALASPVPKMLMIVPGARVSCLKLAPFTTALIKGAEFDGRAHRPASRKQYPTIRPVLANLALVGDIEA